MRNLRLKRVYLPPDDGDGQRVLVDRLWPRGLLKRDARVDLWLKDVAPSPELRRWFGHDPEKWPEFRRRYFAELNARSGPVETLSRLAENADVTLLYAAHDEAHNNAVVLQDYLAGGGHGLS
ncbi:MAG: DUF488 domain-containing protein [Thermomicrobiales bacterium]|jgi:uncharacterized protein YeaO (DUF488 family)